LTPIITDFIRNTKRELYDEKLEDALEMLDLEWSKDDDAKMQCNRLNTSPLHRGNASDKNGPARVKQRMQWETPSETLANGSNMGEPIRTRKRKLAGRGKHDARLGRVVQVKKRGGGNPLI